MEQLSLCDYVRIEPVYELASLDLSYFLYASFSQSAESFFRALNDFQSNRMVHGRKRLCIQMDILLPDVATDDTCLSIGKTFMKEFCPELPYCFYHYKAGLGHYLRFYISERQYKKNGFSEERKSNRDFYVNKLGRMCSKDAEGARLVRKKGDVIESKPCDWSLKTHKFMTNKAKFAELVDEIKTIFSDIFERHRFKQKKHVKLTKIDRRKARNRFQQRNISVINKAVSEIELQINHLAQVLINGYMYDEYKVDFHRIRNRYRTIIANQEFKVGKATLHFTMNTRWDVLDQNIESLKDKFTADLDNIKEKFIFQFG